MYVIYLCEWHDGQAGKEDTHAEQVRVCDDDRRHEDGRQNADGTRQGRRQDTETQMEASQRRQGRRERVSSSFEELSSRAAGASPRETMAADAQRAARHRQADLVGPCVTQPSASAPPLTGAHAKVNKADRAPKLLKHTNSIVAKSSIRRWTVLFHIVLVFVACMLFCRRRPQSGHHHPRSSQDPQIQDTPHAGSDGQSAR